MTTRRAIVWDTSVLDVYLQVPGKATCGPETDKWDHARIARLVEERQMDGTLFVMPIAAILECGNHIAQIKGDRYPLAQKLSELIRSAAEGTTPWAAIDQFEQVWSGESLKQLAADWPKRAAEGLSLSDLTISRVAEHYAQWGMQVEILTGDGGLKALEPRGPQREIPRRRS
jgi:hypothetical protein